MPWQQFSSTSLMWRWVTTAVSFSLSKEKGKINIEQYQLRYQPFILLLLRCHSQQAF